MKYMLMMNAPAGTGEYQINKWSAVDFAAHIQFMIDFDRRLRSAGELIDAHGLTPPTQARLVRAGPDGAPVIDGAFPDTKEFLVGFWIIDVASPARAHALAAQVSAAPGPGGKPLNMPIELRPIAEGPPPQD